MKGNDFSENESEGTCSPLNEHELHQLASLIKKAKNTQIRGEVWYQLVKKFITVPIELCIIDDQNRVFLVYRKDREFDGYHMPGTVVNDWETVKEALARLVQGEVIVDAGFHITEPKSIGWLEVRRGEGLNENKSRNALSLLHVAHLHGNFVPKEGMGFYDFDNLPKNTLSFHKFLLQFFRRYLDDGRIILGE